jgi:hypothetical protein
MRRDSSTAKRSIKSVRARKTRLQNAETPPMNIGGVSKWAAPGSNRRPTD